MTPSGGTNPTPTFIRMSLQHAVQPQAGQLMFNGAFAPAGILKAYGIDQLINNGNNGAGQTIALIDAFDDPAFSSSGTAAFATSDLHYFDTIFGLVDPTFLKVSQTGSSSYPVQDSTGGWESEEALDVEWAHAIAPAAKIILVECNADTEASLYAGADWAATPVANGGGGATVISMSFGSSGSSSELSNDSHFSPAIYPGVTFLASTGDTGSDRNQGEYPADSPNVVAVGGTSLFVDSSGNYNHETVWNDGPNSTTGGGTSNFESQPIYQRAAEPSKTKRTTPDVSFDADPSTGVAVYDSFNGGAGLGSSNNISEFGGTSVASPCWAGLVAIADQIRAGQAIPEAPLTGATQTLPILYNLFGSPAYHLDFHDVTAGGNGTFNAATGYDEVTGIGSPIANNLIPDLADVNQLVYMAPSGTNNYLLQVNSGVLNLYDNGSVVASNPISQTTSVIIGGALNNSLTVDPTNFPATLAVTFDGGPGSLTHALTIQPGAFTNANYTYTGSTSGTIGLDGLAITFSHVTSTTNAATSVNTTFNLLAGAQATLQASGSTNELLTSNVFVPTTFISPTGGLTIDTAGGGSVVNLAAMNAAFNPTNENFSGLVGDAFVFASASAVPATSSLAVATALLDLHGFNPVIDALTGSGIISDNTATASTLTIGSNNGSGTFAGGFADGVGKVALNKTGMGTEILAGTSTASGVCTISGGALQVTGFLTAAVNVQNPATLFGRGVTGPVTVQNGGSLDTATAVSTLTTGSLSLQPGANFNVVLNDSSDYSRDTIAAGGTVSLVGANLVLAGNLIPANGQTLTLIMNNGGQPVSGSFAGLPEGALIANFLGSGLDATISYLGGDGNDVVLYIGTAVNTQTALSASSSTIVYGQAVTYSAVVTAGTTPTGDVEFFDETTGTDLGAGVIISSDSGTATWSYTTTPTQMRVTGGADLIEAFFSSADGFFGSGGLLAGGETVTPLGIAVTGLTAANKVYNQSASATLGTVNAQLIGVLNGDAITLNAAGASGTFASQDVGTAIPVAVAGLMLSGPQAANYFLAQPTTAANITPAPLTVTGVATTNRIYNATTVASLNTSNAALSGVFSGDTVTLIKSGATGTFASKDVGVGIAVSITGLSLGGTQAADYSLTQPNVTANITRAPLNVNGVTAKTKFYDGTTTATLNTANASFLGLFSGDAVVLITGAGTGTFSSKNAGTGILVTVTGLKIGGAQAGDYSLSQPLTSGNITPASLSIIGVTAANKVYNGTSAATLNTNNATLAGVISGDSVTVNASAATGTFAAKSVGVNLVVTITGFALGGAQAGNYTVVQPSAFANITAAPVTVSGLTANSKVYDGTQSATLNTGSAILNGVLSGDTVNLNTGSGTGTFAGMNVANGVAVTITGLTLSGAQAGNYALSQPTVTANITPAPVTIMGIAAANKVYDATTQAALINGTGALKGVLAGDIVNWGEFAATATFASKDVANNITVTITGLTLGGPQAMDYSLTPPTTAANITPAPLTITGMTASNKQFDGTSTAALNTNNATLAGVLGQDVVSLNAGGAVGTFAIDGPGNNIPVFVTGITISGAQVADYQLIQPGTTATIVGPATQFVVTVLGNPALVAGNSFLFSVQATDQNGNPLLSYGGPSNITLATTPADPLSKLATTGTLNSSGYGIFFGTLDTAGAYTVTASTGTYSGATGKITVTPSTATHFVLSAASAVTSGSPLGLTVQALDQYGNIATSYGGTVHFTSSDPHATLPGDSSLTGGVGNFNVALNLPGTQTISATDTTSTNPFITGTSNPILAGGLTVTSFTSTPDGFTATFSKAIVPADPALYGSNLTTVPDVTVVGNKDLGPIHGSLLIDPSNQRITFKATSSYLQVRNNIVMGTGISSPVLPDGTYTVTLVSGSGANGFEDALGVGLDGANNGGHANFVTTFTTNYQANHTPVLSIPDFARGPDSNTPIEVPNAAAGIPITLFNASGATDVSFTLKYDPTLLTITGTLQGVGSDASDPAGTLTLVADSGGLATFTFHDAIPQSGTVVLGDITAFVPDSAANQYQAKELLQLGNIALAPDPGLTPISADGIHVNAYLGDVNANHNIEGLDKLAIDNVAQGRATGFSAYPLLDPVIVGDPASDLQVDAGDVSLLDAYIVQLHPTQLPVPPGLSGITSPNAPDPTLSLQKDEGGRMKDESNIVSDSSFILHPSSFSINLDDPRPAGSTGMTQAILTLTYDPKVLNITPADITLGSIPSQGTGWQLSSIVDQASGQIVIFLYSSTPIAVNQAGSLVNVAYHVVPGAMAFSTTINLVNSASPFGMPYSTAVADAQGAMILSPGLDQLNIDLELGRWQLSNINRQAKRFL